jgi:hypothetical protein
MMTGKPAPRLSARANVVLTLAHELGRREPGIEPNSGHVLIALVREGGSVVEDTFSNLGVRYEDVLSAVSLAEGAPDAKAELTDFLNVAERIAVGGGQTYVEAAHLLAASIENPRALPRARSPRSASRANGSRATSGPIVT